MQMTLVLKFYQFLSAEKYPKGYTRRGNHVFPNWRHKKINFFQAQISYRVERVPFDQIKFRKKCSKPKMLKV